MMIMLPKSLKEENEVNSLGGVTISWDHLWPTFSVSVRVYITNEMYVPCPCTLRDLQLFDAKQNADEF